MERFGIYRVNVANPLGVLIASTLSGISNPLTGLQLANPAITGYDVFFELTGTCMIDIQVGDTIELRKLNGLFEPTYLGSGTGADSVAVMNIMKVGDLLV